MSIMELGALGEFVASLVVLVTLVYLTAQVRQTKELSQQAARESRNTNMRELQLAVALSDHLAPIHAQAREAFGVKESRLGAALIERGLTLEQAIRFETHQIAVIRNHQTQFRAYVPESERKTIDTNVRRQYDHPLGRAIWSSFREIGSLSPDFVAYVDDLLAEGGRH